MTEEKANVSGRKVFFLYPPSVIQDELIYEFIKHGYEIYLLRDHSKTLLLLKQFKDSIFFINIDKVLSQFQWEEYIREIMSDPEMSEVKLGVLTYNIDPEMEKRYVEIIRLPYGYVRLKMARQDSLDILLKNFESHEAKGRRQFVRARCEGDMPVTFYAKTRDETLTGRVLDISAAGMACEFDKEPNLAVHSRLAEIHINLHQVILRVPGSVSVVRGDARKAYIVMFDSDTSEVTLDKIYIYVFSNLQRFIERKLKELK